MSQSVERRCDHCGAIISSKTWEFGAWVAVVNGTRREIQTTKETCSHACATALFSGMLRDVETAAVKTDGHANGKDATG